MKEHVERLPEGARQTVYVLFWALYLADVLPLVMMGHGRSVTEQPWYFWVFLLAMPLLITMSPFIAASSWRWSSWSTYTALFALACLVWLALFIAELLSGSIYSLTIVLGILIMYCVSRSSLASLGDRRSRDTQS